MTSNTHAHIKGLCYANCSCLAWRRVLRVCVFVCVAHPSRAWCSWSTMGFGLTVGRWLTAEAPSLHYSLKTLTNATEQIGEGKKKSCLLKAHVTIILNKCVFPCKVKKDLFTRCWNRKGGKKKEKTPRGVYKSLLSRTYDLAVTSTYWPGRKCAAYRGVPEHTTNRITLLNLYSTCSAHHHNIIEPSLWHGQCCVYCFDGKLTEVCVPGLMRAFSEILNVVIFCFGGTPAFLNISISFSDLCQSEWREKRVICITMTKEKLEW